LGFGGEAADLNENDQTDEQQSSDNEQKTPHEKLLRKAGYSVIVVNDCVRLVSRK
jgi:hypothetical protein